MDFELASDIANIEIIATGNAIRELPGLQARFGAGRWRKLKGRASVYLLYNDTIRLAEVHWYEAHGIGRRRMKIKRFLD